MNIKSKISEAAKPTPASGGILWAIKTWRYLRLSLVLLALGLFASVGYEFFRNPAKCWQTSISAYYYTPVQAFFVSALLAIGIALIALKGSSDGEDILLNLAGMCAPFVAFVPTPYAGRCGTVKVDLDQRGVNISNNVSALLIMGSLALALLALLSRRPGQPKPNRQAVAGYWVAVAVWVATVVVFFTGREWFKSNGHNIAAVAMFTFFLLNVFFNAVSRQRTAGSDMPGQRWIQYVYWGVVALMIVVAALIVYVGIVGDWAYWVLVIETSLIALFMVFWIVQCIELWDYGLRPENLSDPPPAKGKIAL